LTDVLTTDLETMSATDIKNGVYRYTEDPEFRITLCAYAINDGPVRLVDVWHGEPLPAEYLDAAGDPAVIKTAFNAAFERLCLRQHGLLIPIEQWQCTSVLALTLGLPQHLADVAKVLRLSQDKQKMAVGKKLIRKFCIPQKDRKTGEKFWITPDDAPADWETFKEYCIRDVEVEREIAGDGEEKRLGRRDLAALAGPQEAQVGFLH
jgi:DNA polymerase